MGPGSRRRAQRLAREHGDPPQPVGRRHGGDGRRAEVLVAGAPQLLRRREVHPELEPVHAPALAEDARAWQLGVHDAGPGRHPLGVAGHEPPTAAPRVAVVHLAGEEVGHRLEPTVGMVRRALGLARGIVGGPHLVEQDERVEELQGGRGKGPADREPRALPAPGAVHQPLHRSKAAAPRHAWCITGAGPGGTDRGDAVRPWPAAAQRRQACDVPSPRAWGTPAAPPPAARPG